MTPGLETELGLVHRFATPGSVAVDVGANHGVYTRALSRAVGPHGRVLAYEPQAKLAAYIRAGTSRARNVTVYQAALGSTPGTAELTVPLREGRPETAWATLRADAGPGDRQQVQLRMLDEDLASLAPSFIKIDVEGFELAVVEGALNTLERSRPVTMIEIEYRWAGDSAAKTLHVMRELAYEPWAADASADGQLRQLEWAALSDVETMNDVLPGQRTFNFLFRPRD
jgi:FkbM family methyltransferase